MLTKIEIKSPLKSITPFIWDNIPQLAIITGVNGVGKSQLLQFINNAIVNSTHPNHQNRNTPAPNIVFLTDNNRPPSFQETVFIPSTWQPGNFSGVARANIDGINQNFINWVRGRHKPNPIPTTYIKLQEEIQKQHSRSLESLTDPEILSSIPFDFTEQDERITQNNHLSSVFMGYLSKEKNLVHEAFKGRKAISEKEIIEKLGEAPWNKVNNAFEKYGFVYRVNYPESDAIPFHCKFTDPKNPSIEIDFADLSSGERMIVTFILWSYNVEVGSLSNLFIMDEPDAHLHPSMCKLFLEIVTKTLVEEYGIQVLLTTHNPSTVALAPENSLYIMNKDQTARIQKASKLECISKLTENLLLVTTSFRVVLTEDKNDCKFYETIYSELRALDILQSNPPLVFKPAATKEHSGGVSVVKQWVEKLNEAKSSDSSLEKFIHGIIDKDLNNQPSQNLHVLSRYAIENYLLDPILVFSALLLHDHADAQRIATGFNYTKGSLSNLYDEKVEVLNAIAQEIFKLVEPKLDTTLNKSPVDVEFINGIRLQYPHYLINNRGHDLFQVFQGIFSTNILSREELMRALAITRFISKDLLEIFKAIQS